MYKTISVYDLPPGTNREAFWEYHTRVHAQDVKQASRGLLKKFVINRIIDVVNGELKAFGLIEMWWENKEAAGEYKDRAREFKTASGKSPPDDFFSRGVISRFRLHVEEVEITLD
jgi:hypothetical protein